MIEVALSLLPFMAAAMLVMAAGMLLLLVTGLAPELSAQDGRAIVFDLFGGVLPSRWQSSGADETGAGTYEGRSVWEASVTVVGPVTTAAVTVLLVGTTSDQLRRANQVSGGSSAGLSGDVSWIMTQEDGMDTSDSGSGDVTVAGSSI